MPGKNSNKLILSPVFLLVFGALLQVLFTGCKTKDGQPEENKEIGKIEPVKEKNPNLTVGMCRILGMLSEYMGRFNFITGKPRPGLVESFGVDELEIADRFEEMILAYHQETGKTFSLKRDPPGSGLVFESHKLSEIINSFYIVDKEKHISGTLDLKVLDQASENCRLAFVQGAYMRFGLKGANALKMANGYYKIATLAHVLEGLGCQHVRIYSMETIPVSNLLVFRPTERLKGLLPINRQLREEELKGYEEVKE